MRTGTDREPDEAAALESPPSVASSRRLRANCHVNKAFSFNLKPKACADWSTRPSKTPHFFVIPTYTSTLVAPHPLHSLI